MSEVSDRAGALFIALEHETEALDSEIERTKITLSKLQDERDVVLTTKNSVLRLLKYLEEEINQAVEIEVLVENEIPFK
jgi:hypothetical protein